MRVPRITQTPLHHSRPSQSKLPVFRRSFLTAPVQTLSATRTLPHPKAAIYSIIADVPSYSSFLPYCSRSQVTRWSGPDDHGQKWPEEALLAVGWGGIEESFRSKIYCVPGSIVEAVGGKARTKLGTEQIRHHTHASGASTASSGDGILTHLMTRWTVRPLAEAAKGKESVSAPVGGDRTQVTLAIEFQFANPVYSAMSAAVSEKVAGVMIEAFEKRVQALMDKQQAR